MCLFPLTTSQGKKRHKEVGDAFRCPEPKRLFLRSPLNALSKGWGAGRAEYTKFYLCCSFLPTSLPALRMRTCIEPTLKG